MTPLELFSPAAVELRRAVGQRQWRRIRRRLKRAAARGDHAVMFDIVRQECEKAGIEVAR